MINEILLMYLLFDRKFNLDFNGGNYTVNFTDGDLFELNKKLLLSETKYPIIWLQSGYRVTDFQLGNKMEMNNCNFFLITKGDPHDLYKKRHETNYQELLMPLYQKFKETLRKAKGIEIMNERIEFVKLPFNDVSELTARDNQLGRKRTTETATVTDIWDAIVINGLNLKISTDCYPGLKI